jgi:hypothetical protein
MSKGKKQKRAGEASPPTTRELVPAELRYQFLKAGPGRAPVRVGGFAIAIGVVVGFVAASELHSKPAGLLVTIPVVWGIATALRGLARLLPPSKDYRAVPVGIVPWGVVLDPDGASIPVSWSRLGHVGVTAVQEDDGGAFWARFNFYRQDRRDEDAPARVIVTFETKGGTVQATGEEGTWLTWLRASAPRVTRAANRPPAGDLHGTAALAVEGVPVSLALLRCAETLLASPDARASLGLSESYDYRATRSSVVGPTTPDLLRRALWSAPGELDPGPLAAVLAAELGVAELLPDLLRLLLSPSPLLAGVAKAAALRLGASLRVAGSFEELEPFLAADEIAELRRWAGQRA